MTGQQIIDEYRSREGKDFSQRELADILGWSPGTLSGVLSGNYPKAETKVAEMAERLLGVRLADQDGGFVPIQVRDVTIATKDFQAVYELCNGLLSPDSSLSASIGLVIGDAGMGKTTSVQRYAAEHSAACYVLYMGYTRASLFREIAEALVGRSHVAYYSNLQLIMNTTQVFRKLIIIDEADRMPLSLLEDLRTLNERGRVPLLLVGEPTLARTVRRADRIESRIRKPRIEFHRLDPVTLATLYSESCGLRIQADVARSLVDMASGDFRIAVNDMQNIVRMMNVSGQGELTRKVLDEYRRQ